MSSSWNGKMKWKLLTLNKKPSPTHHRKNHIPDSARNPDPFLGGGACRSSVLARFMEGISLFPSLSGKTNASMTVEAAIVLPLFLFFFLNLGCAIEMIRLHGNLQLALWQAGSKLSVYGYAVSSGEEPEEDSGEEGWWQDLAGTTVTSTYVKGQMIRSAGKEYLNHSPLSYGANGLQLWESDVFGTNDEIDITVTYSVSPWGGLIGFLPFRMVNRFYAHIWNGYQLSGEEEKTQIVYITENGTVYHLTRECTHLQLSVSQIPASAIETARNQYGGKYYPCARCVSGSAAALLYITDDGNRYHNDRECSGLKRTIYSMSIEEAVKEGYRACSRCGH